MTDSAGEPSEPGEDRSAERATGWTLVEQARYERGDVELATTIVYAVAAAEGVEPTEVRSPPLYDAVDVAALEAALFGSAPGSDADSSMTFRYRGHRVEVASDGWVSVYDPE